MPVRIGQEASIQRKAEEKMRKAEKDKQNALELEALSEAIVDLKNQAASTSWSLENAMRGQRSAISERDAYAAELKTLKADYANLQAKYEALVIEEFEALTAEREAEREQQVNTVQCHVVIELHIDDKVLHLCRLESGTAETGEEGEIGKPISQDKKLLELKWL